LKGNIDQMRTLLGYAHHIQGSILSRFEDNCPDGGNLRKEEVQK